MNAITYLDRNESGSVACPAPQPVIHPAGPADKLKPARGLVIGLVISVGFWLLVGTGAWLLFGH